MFQDPWAVVVLAVVVALAAFLVGRASKPKIPGEILTIDTLPMKRRMVIAGRIDGYGPMTWVRFQDQPDGGFLVNFKGIDEVPEIGNSFIILPDFRCSSRIIRDLGPQKDFELELFCRPAVTVS